MHSGHRISIMSIDSPFVFEFIHGLFDIVQALKLLLVLFKPPEKGSLQDLGDRRTV